MQVHATVSTAFTQRQRLHGAKAHAKTRAKTHAKTHANIFFASNCDKPPKCLIKVSCKILRRKNFVIRGLSKFDAKKNFARVFACVFARVFACVFCTV